MDETMEKTVLPGPVPELGDDSWHYLCDITVDELRHPETNKQYSRFLDYLHQAWVGSYPERATEVRVGSLDIEVDDDGSFCMKLIPRWRDPDVIKKIKPNTPEHGIV